MQIKFLTKYAQTLPFPSFLDFPHVRQKAHRPQAITNKTTIITLDPTKYNIILMNKFATIADQYH